jgi:G:T-mismatch repair DNA endonuclease (very short patch repair protein)
MLNKQALKFLNRKHVKDILRDKVLTQDHIDRLNRFFSVYSCKEVENMHSTIAKFILYNLNNYIGRYKRLKGIPGTSRYGQLLRYGKKMSITIWSDQSSKKTKHFKNQLQYWTKKGFSKLEAKRKVSEVQKQRSVLSPSTQKGASEFSVRCVGYWIKKGFSELEAKEKVSTYQRRRHTKERNERWLATLNSKTEEEKKLINLKKGHSIEAFIARGYSEKEATLLSIDYYKKRANYSDISQKFFSLLESMLECQNVFYKIKNYEKQINGKNVDFYHTQSKIAVEFYGDFWHRNPKKYKKDLLVYGKTSEQIWNDDQSRIKTIELDQNVKKVIIVWEGDVKKNPHAVAENIAKEINKWKS